jgi:hypothetical protein
MDKLDTSTAADGLAWQALEPFGARLDIDLQQSLTKTQADQFVGLFYRYSLLVFHNQTLSQQRQIQIAGMIDKAVHARDGISVLSHR